MKSKELYEEILEILEGDFSKYKNDYLRLKEMEKSSEAYYDGQPVPFLYSPRFFNEEEMLDLHSIVDKSVELFDRVVELYKKEEGFRQLFGFPKNLEELILLENPLEKVYPMARMDVFYRGLDDFSFCEINTDGSSAMNEDRVLKELFFDSELYKTLKARGYEIEGFELFESWVEYVLSNWNKNTPPRIGILDTDIDNDEFRRFGAHFEKRGCEVDYVMPQELDVDRDGYLAFKGKPLDYIYRRLVTSDFYKLYDELPKLVEGIRCGKTQLFGPIASQIIHNKVLFFVLHHPDVQHFFTPEQREFVKKHVPYTALVDEKLAKNPQFIEHKDEYLLKPTDSYASRGIFLGRDMDSEQWRDTLESLVGREYLIQAFAKLPAIEMLSFEEGVKSFNHMTGIFVYNGKLQGFFSRACQGPIIASSYGGKSLATLSIKKV
ncbi:MAG: glutathionylspermidine synthase family protein [Tissierellia bacterium]|nr:glutathionylspermidine synthase family protein [Tissierellia bacterium]